MLAKTLNNNNNNSSNNKANEDWIVAIGDNRGEVSLWRGDTDEKSTNKSTVSAKVSSKKNNKNVIQNANNNLAVNNNNDNNCITAMEYLNAGNNNYMKTMNNNSRLSNNANDQKLLVGCLNGVLSTIDVNTAQLINTVEQAHDGKITKILAIRNNEF
jgi:hypothetical protein